MPIEWFAYTAYFFGKKPSDHNMHVPGAALAKKAVVIPIGESMPADEIDTSGPEFTPKGDPVVMAEAERERENAAIAAAADRVAQQFDRAWLHHIHLNPHHWQYWVLRQDVGEIKCLEMPVHFIREMVADWIGAGFAQGKTSRDAVQVWYSRNKDKIQLHQRTRELVEALIKVYVHS